MKTVGAFAAKTHLAELLDQVERGEEITITRHGRPIARLTPVQPRDDAATRAAIDGILRGRRGNRLRGTSLKELIEDGRR